MAGASSQVSNVIQNLDGDTMARLIYGDHRPWLSNGSINTITQLTCLTYSEIIDYIGFVPWA